MDTSATVPSLQQDKAFVSYPLTRCKLDAGFVFLLPVLLDLSAKMNGDLEIIFGVVEDNFMQLSAMAIEYRRLWILWWCRLRNDVLPGIFVDSETVLYKINAQRPHFLCYGAINSPSSKYPTSIGSKRDNVSQCFEDWKRLIYLDLMPLSMTFYSRCKTSESCSQLD